MLLNSEKILNRGNFIEIFHIVILFNVNRNEMKLILS